jgi:serine/threonine-protein kinase SRK2
VLVTPTHLAIVME